ncbi:MAG: LysR family transcriptional regulator [Pseudomonadota bacterium]
MNIDDMDLNLLRTFQVVADERSVTKAAERLSLGQPAVSNGL